MMFKLMSVSDFERVKDEVFVIKAPVMSCPEIIEGTDCVMVPGSEECDSLPQDRSAKIVVYCCRGFASQNVAQRLILKGYENVHSLEGGMFAYQRFKN